MGFLQLLPDFPIVFSSATDRIPVKIVIRRPGIVVLNIPSLLLQARPVRPAYSELLFDRIVFHIPHNDFCRIQTFHLAQLLGRLPSSPADRDNFRFRFVT